MVWILTQEPIWSTFLPCLLLGLLLGLVSTIMATITSSVGVWLWQYFFNLLMFIIFISSLLMVENSTYYYLICLYHYLLLINQQYYYLFIYFVPLFIVDNSIVLFIYFWHFKGSFPRQPKFPSPYFHSFRHP